MITGIASNDPIYGADAPGQQQLDKDELVKLCLQYNERTAFLPPSCLPGYLTTLVHLTPTRHRRTPHHLQYRGVCEALIAVPLFSILVGAVTFSHLIWRFII